MPQLFMGEEYPAHFRFYSRNGNAPQEGEEIGYVWDFYPDICEEAANLCSTKLVWISGCVNQVSADKD